MPRLPRHFEIDDLNFSGPHVWPSSSARDTLARFIQRRPELTYLSARKEAMLVAEREGREPEAADRIRCTVVLIDTIWTGKGKRKRQEKVSSFVHARTKPLDEDVPEFLIHLDRFLRRNLSLEPDPYLCVQLQFSLRSGARGKRLATFQAKWL